MARHGLIAALVVVLLTPAGAVAQEQEDEIYPRTRYGGGWAGETRQLWLRAAVDETGRFLSFAGRVEAACASGDLSAAGVPVEQARGFALQGTTREGAVVTRWRLSGELSPGRGRGRLDATVTVRRPGRDRRCKVTARPWVLSAGGSYASGRPAPGARFHGTLDGGGTVAILKASDDDELAVVALGMDMSFCPRRPAGEFWAVVREVPLDEQAVARDVIREGSVVRRVRISISGYFSGTDLEISVSIREVARSARTGRRLWGCDTQTLSGEASLFGPAIQAPASSES